MMRVVLRKNPRHTGVMVFMRGDDKEQKHHHPCVPLELETFLVLVSKREMVGFIENTAMRHR